MSRRAVVLAGGMGTRLRPYTIVLPKPLMPIGEFPILEVIIRQLAVAGFDHITMAVNHQAEIIKAFFGQGERWGIKIDYSLEDQPLGTMGPLKLIGDLPNQFLIMNGDILTDLNYRDIYDNHVLSDSIFTISSCSRSQSVDYGVLETRDGRLVGLKEKPIIKCEVSMGIYIASRKIIDYIPDNKIYGFDLLMHDLIASDQHVSVLPFNGYWLDIGRPDDYDQAITEFDEMRARFLIQ
jgi:NDP-sugar pyrophosphorylase family protein